MQLRYRGNHAAPYDPTTGLGLIGKVLGPTAHSRWLRIVDATYNAEDGYTYCETALLQDPSTMLDRQLEVEA